MTILLSLSESHYPNDWIHSFQSSNHSFLFPLEEHANLDSESIRTLFSPSAGAYYVYQPGKQRRALNAAIDRLEASCQSGFEYAISYLYDKYRRDHTVSSLSQTGQTLSFFLSLFKG